MSNAFNTARWLACLFAAALSVLAFCNTLKPDYLVCCLLCSLTSPCFDALRGFRWVFSAACVFVALRAIILTPVLLRSQRAQISLLSVKHALDALPDGLMFARSDGFVRLQNEAVMRLCDRIDGGTVSDATNFESYGGRWTADNGAMGRYLEFSLTDEAAGCRSGNPGEQRQRPTADISALELTAEGVYHLSVCYPGEEPDDMDNGREERWEEYYILPLENGRIAVSGEQGGSETIYYFESGQTA